MRPLTLIKVLRKLPHSAGFDRHLTDCAALEVVYRESNPALPRLTFGHVFGWEPLPDFTFSGPRLAVSNDG